VFVYKVLSGCAPRYTCDLIAPQTNTDEKRAINRQLYLNVLCMQTIDSIRMQTKQCEKALINVRKSENN